MVGTKTCIHTNPPGPELPIPGRIPDAAKEIKIIISQSQYSYLYLDFTFLQNIALFQDAEISPAKQRVTENKLTFKR